MARDQGDMETNFEVRSHDLEIPLEEYRARLTELLLELARTQRALAAQ